MPDTVEIQITAMAQGAEDAIARLRGALHGLQGDASNTSGTARCRDSLNEVGATGRMTARRLNDLCDTTRNLTNTTNRANRAHNTFLGTIGRIGRMMLLRMAIRAVMSAIRDGINYLYEWSKLHDKTFSKAMNKAASNILYMKNSIATVLAPAIMALMPILEGFVQFINMASNAVAEFIAIITGQESWVKATYAEAEYQTGLEQTSKTIKELLADWDELNIIQSETGKDKDTGLPSYSAMFDEVELEGWKKKVSEFFAYFKEPLTKLLTIAGKIGAAFLLWRIGRALFIRLGTLFQTIVGIYAAAISVISIFDAWNNGINLNNMIGMIGGALVAVLALRMALGGTVAGAVGLILGLGITVTGVHDQIVNGLSWENLTTQISGIGIAALGAGLLFGGMGVGAIALAGGISQVVLGFKEFLETGKLTKELSLQIGIGFGLIGLAIFLLTGMWIPALIAVVAGLVTIIIGHWEEIKEKWNEFKSKTIDPAVQWIQLNVIAPIAGWFSALGTNVRTSMTNAVQWFTDAWNKAKEIVNWIQLNIIAPLVGWFSGLGTNIKGSVDKAVKWFTDTWNSSTGVVDWVSNYVIAPITGYFSGLATNVKSASDNAVKWFTETWSASDGLADWVSNYVIAPISGYFNGLATRVKSSSDKAVQWFTNAWKSGGVQDWISNNIIAPISGWFSGLATNIRGASDNAVKWFTDVWKSTGVPDWISNNIIAPVSGYFSGLATNVKSAASKAVTWFGDAWKSTGVPDWISNNIIAPISGYFSGLSTNIKSASNRAVNWFTETWSASNGIADWVLNYVIAPISGYFSGLATNVKSAVSNAVKWFIDKWSEITGIPESTLTTIIAPISGYFSGLATNIKSASNNAIKWFTETWSASDGLADWVLNHVIAPITGYFSGLATNVKSAASNAIKWFTDAWDTTTDVPNWVLVNIVSPISGWFSGLATNIKGAMTNGVTWFKDAWDGIGKWIDTNVVQPILTFFKSGINGIIGAVNSFITTLNTLNLSIPTKEITLGWPFNQTFSIGGWTIGFSDIPTIPELASGGMVDSGSLFLANENGVPEMVGRIGNQTTVANNDQIVSGIAAGVAEANSALDMRLARLENLMERFISKKFYAEVKPSTSLGRVVRQSEEMRLRTEGV